MGIDTKGVVVTPCKDVIFVVDKVRGAVDRLIQPGLAAERRVKGFYRKKDEARQFVSTTAEFSYTGSGMVTVDFRYKGQARSMHAHFTCDVDYKTLGEHKLIFSLGCWGDSELLMKAALQSLSMLGDVYFDCNDCDLEELAKLDIEPHNFLTCAEAGLGQGDILDLKKWVEMYDDGLLREGTFEDVVGLPRHVVNAILKMSCPESDNELKKHVGESIERGRKARKAAVESLMPAQQE
jgi:hypothetical protein